MEPLKTCVCPRCWGKKLEPSPAADNACRLCTGAGYVEDPELSVHFRFSEFVQSSTAAHLGMPNDPPTEALANLRRLSVELLEPLRDVLGPLRVTSGFRTQQLDVVADGGNPRWLRELSAHAIGAAADVVALDPAKTLKNVFDAVVALHRPFDQLISEGGCAHVALLCSYGAPNARQRGQALVRILNPARAVFDAAGGTGPAPDRHLYVRFDGSAEQWAKVA